MKVNLFCEWADISGKMHRYDVSLMKYIMAPNKIFSTVLVSFKYGKCIKRFHPQNFVLDTQMAILASHIKCQSHCLHIAANHSKLSTGYFDNNGR